MKDNILIDYINIKNLPELIISFLKDNDINSNLNNIRGIYSIILGNISEDVKESYLNKIQKYLSANEPCQILIFDDINDNIYDKELKNACIEITKNINKSTNNIELYQNLLSKCYFIHFKQEELDDINNIFEKQDYEEFIFRLFKHAISNYKISTPKILAKRIYDDAMTLSKDTTIRKNLFKIAADLGNSYAALNYATTIYNEDLNERLTYFLKCKDLDVSLWKIGYIIEKCNLTKQQFEEIQFELKDIINFSKDYQECQNISPARAKNDFEKECVIVAFKIYYYLAVKKNFSKGYNSLGKFLINNIIAYVNNDNLIDEVKTKEKGIDYLKKGVSLSNLHAMENLAIYYNKNNLNQDLIKPLLLIGAENEDLISCVELSKILMKEGKIDESINYLKSASYQKSPYAQHNLAKIYENNFDYENAKYWYKEAIKNGSYNSSVNLAQIYFKEYMDNDTSIKKSYLLYAINTLENYNNLLDEKHKEIASNLLKNWNELVK